VEELAVTSHSPEREVLCLITEVRREREVEDLGTVQGTGTPVHCVMPWGVVRQ
jgi:hypothetical protein